MLLKPGRLWRALGTGFCFLAYATLSFALSITLLPLMLLWPGDAAARQRRVRLFASGSVRALLGGVQLLGLGQVEIEGREWLAQAEGKLVVATHPMYLDVVALLALMPFADCVIKSAMMNNP